MPPRKHGLFAVALLAVALIVCLAPVGDAKANGPIRKIGKAVMQQFKAPGTFQSRTFPSSDACPNGQCEIPSQNAISASPNQAVTLPDDALPFDCPNGQCPLPPRSAPRVNTVPAQTVPAKVDRTASPATIATPCQVYALELNELTGDDTQIDLTAPAITEASGHGDRMTQVIRATCRITVRGVCGSGTVVGKDADGSALVLTNAHVAGTRKGTTVNIQRWNADGSSESGRGQIVASGYARGLSVDFALLRAESGFASDVTPIPLADRYPDESAGVTNFGCPRCEWPSMQVLKMRSASSQVLRWHPEAIGGRSGSSLIDYADGSPKVVGLLTWGGGGEGLGQSTPFLLDAMRGRMPKSFEPLPMYAREMAAFQTPEIPRQAVCQIDGAIPPFRESSGLLVSAFSPTDTASGQTPSGYIGSITDGGQTVDNPPEDDAQPDESRLIDRIRERPKQPSTEDDEGTGFFNRQPRAPGFFERIGILFGKVVWCIIGFAVGFTVAKLAPLFSPVNALKALFSK